MNVALLPSSEAPQPRPARFALEDYLRMAEDSYFANGRYEFIDGEILRMPPQRNDHAFAVSKLVRALDRLLGDRLWVRGQMTLRVGELAMPEPDVAVVAGPPRGGKDYPTTALFVVEVSDTTLQYDRETKASLYARAGVPEYWIINLVDRRVEVNRTPVEEPSARFGWGYAFRQCHEADVALPLPASLDKAGATLRGLDLLPQA